MMQKKWPFMDSVNYAINVEAQVIMPENAQLKAKGKGAKEEGRVKRKAKAKAKVLTSKEQKVKERPKAVMTKEKAKGKHRRMEYAGHVEDHISAEIARKDILVTGH